MDDHSVSERSQLLPKNSSTRSRTREVSSESLPRWTWRGDDSNRRPTIKQYIHNAMSLPVVAIQALVKLSQGPEEIKIQTIKPFYPSIQNAPLHLVERYLKTRKHKFPAIFIYWTSFAVVFSGLLWRSANSGNVQGYGLASPMSCSDTLWGNDKGCGVNGTSCQPFSNLETPFRCPASCKNTLLQEPYPIGPFETTYTPLVVGGRSSDGTPVYRGDSLVCQAAIHAGIISNSRGGCGVMSLIGSQSDFRPSYSNGIQSFAFNAAFPKAFTFLENTPNDCESADVRWQLLIVSVIYTCVFSLLVNSPALFFFPLSFVLFLHISLVSDPPDVPDYATRFSLFIGKLVPVMFITAVYYRFTISPTLKGLKCQVEKTILWLGGAWIGALNNYTFKDIPIQRLTPHDLRQAGAITALICIVMILLLIAVGQAYYLWLEHRFRKYLALYVAFIAFLLAGVALPTHHVRIHHYLLALLFLPGTAIQTRPSLFYQGLLIGLFLNGIGRWGFAPILETPEMLFAGLPEFRPLPNITSSLAIDASHLDFSWSWPPVGYVGVSMLVNDVERYRWYVDNKDTELSWYSQVVRSEAEYFRFAYIHGKHSNLDYTKAGTWGVDYSWSGIADAQRGTASVRSTKETLFQQRLARMVG